MSYLLRYVIYLLVMCVLITVAIWITGKPEIVFTSVLSVLWAMSATNAERLNKLEDKDQ